MTFDQTLVASVTGDLDTAVEPYSAEWWQHRSAEELRDIIKRGFSGGEAFRGAVSETERRAREETRRLRDMAARQADRRRWRKQAGVGAVAVVAIAAFAGFWVAL